MRDSFRQGTSSEPRIVELEIEDGDDCRHVTFSGDLGVEGARLLSAAGAGGDAGNPSDGVDVWRSRSRDQEDDRTEELYKIVRDTVERGGKVVIPSFAVGRTQEILARLNDLIESGRLKRRARVRRFADGCRGDRGLHSIPRRLLEGSTEKVLFGRRAAGVRWAAAGHEGRGVEGDQRHRACRA